MKVARASAAAGAIALLVLVAYWGQLASEAGAFRVGQHDGMICEATPVGSPPGGFCGLSFTPVFALALVGIVVATVFALAAALQGKLALLRVAAGASILALVLVGVDWWRGNEEALAPGRGVFHAIMLGLALAAFATASRAAPLRSR